MAELSEEDVFANDIDPLDAIREIRKEEGVPEEDLPVSDAETSSQKVVDTEDNDSDDFKEGFENEDTSEESEESKKKSDTTSDESTDEDSSNADEDSDEDSDEDEDEGEEEKPASATKREFTANGKKFEFSEEEMLDQFEVVFGQAMDYTQKTQKIAPYRKMISALEQEGITDDQLNIAIDALKGNKGAIQTLLKSNNIDAYDLSEDDEEESGPYTPQEYGKNEVQLGIEEIAAQISKDPEYKITVDVIDGQWDSSSRQRLSSNPRMIQGLHNDIKSGVYDKVAPVAMKMKVLDGNTKSDIEYYVLAGEQVLTEEQNSANAEQTVTDSNQQAQAAEDDFDQASSEARRKRSATPTRKRTDRKGVIDYLDDDDKNFDAWYKNLMAKN